MISLDRPLFEVAAFREADSLIRKGAGPVRIAGVTDSVKVHMMMKAGGDCSRLIVAYDEQEALSIVQDARFFSDRVYYFPPKDFLFYQADAHSNAIVRDRVKAIRKLLSEENVTVVATIQSLMNVLPPKSAFETNTIALREGDVVDLETLGAKLVSIGYERVAQVGEPGQFALHGGILDLFEMTEDEPYRIEFFGDEIDTIRIFEPSTQTSIRRAESATIFPATEFLTGDESAEERIAVVKWEYDRILRIMKDRKDYEAAASLQQFFGEVSDAFSAHETVGIVEQFLPYFYEELPTIAEYLPEGSIIALSEPVRAEEYAKLCETEFLESFKQRLEKGLTMARLALVMKPVGETLAILTTKRTIAFTSLDQKITSMKIASSFRVECEPAPRYDGSVERLIEDLKRFGRLKFSVIMLIASRTRGRRMAEELREYGLHAFYEEKAEETVVREGTLLVTPGTLSHGALFSMQKFLLLTESDLFGTGNLKKKRTKRFESGEKIRSYESLSAGDYVVHENYGIGVYRGVKTLQTEGVSRDYIEISYADSGTLYIPVTNLDVVQKYSSSNGETPKISKLDSPEWKRTKSRVKAAVEEVADHLVKLYSARQYEQGYEYGPDTVWQREFEEMFPYEETEDQLQAIRDVKQDMESTKIMDRLICGDVGFGKTEVAIRAAFKAVQEGKQVAFLVPTTILADQHYHTFTERMQQYPVTIEILSRFRTAKQQKETIENLKKGMTDIVIGTHTLLSDRVKFKDLGLLIIDEEQRFGVNHKEKIKEMKTNVDVLTLSATPIPRTLHMSMIGVRDMSLLTEPPEDRRPIQTYVMEYSEELVREAIRREISRNGQVYYVYNRVSDIAEIASSLQQLLPDASVAYIHGRMNEREIEDRMLSFIEGSIDVLVSTTIIETGLDIPNVNTIIIHDAERYGLAQLYQLRGRVGRSGRQAYAFIMYRKNRMLSEVAEKRLSALRQFTDLGSGMKIALKDLEIRGAGTLLGNAQSGHMALVGYDLYCKMLSMAVSKAKGETPKYEEFETVLDIPADAYIPDSYIANESLKIEVYKRISYLSSEEERTALEEELVDRYGDVPKPLENLMEVALLKKTANGLYITKIKGNADGLRFDLKSDGKIDPGRLVDFVTLMRNDVRFINGAAPALVYRPLMQKNGEKEEILPLLRRILIKMKETMG